MEKNKTNRTSIVFTGDIGFDRYMDRKWEEEHFLSEEVLAFFHSAEHTCANVEGALIDAADDGSRGVFFHSMNPEAAQTLKKIGADIWSIGNNHTMDAGREGVLSTKKIAEELGCMTFGAGMNVAEASAPVYLSEAGGIGMFGVSYMTECIPATVDTPGVFRWDDMDTIAKRIAQIKEKCRWCIVVAHGGEEFASLPNPYTRERYIRYLELGADVVVGHHPHVPENYELFDNGKAIFYSLGNLIFDTDYQRVHPYTDIGVLLKLHFSEEVMDFEAFGVRINRAAGRIEAASLPDVFTDIPAEEYALLAPLAAKAFVAEDMKKMIYLEPDRFTDAPQEVWDGYFFSSEPDGFDAGAHMDFNILVPFSKTAESGAWKQSKLEKVKAYILHQFA